MAEDARISYSLGGIELFVGAAAVLIAPNQRILIIEIGGILGVFMTLSAIFWNPDVKWPWKRKSKISDFDLGYAHGTLDEIDRPTASIENKNPWEPSASQGLRAAMEDKTIPTSPIINAPENSLSMLRELGCPNSLQEMGKAHLAIANKIRAENSKTYPRLLELDEHVKKIKGSAFVYLSNQNRSAAMASVLRGQNGNVANMNLSQDPVEETFQPPQNDFSSVMSSRRFTFYFQTPVVGSYRPVIFPVISGDNTLAMPPILRFEEQLQTHCSLKIDFHRPYEFPINIIFEAY